MTIARHLPVNGLRVFEAAARHLSFTRAGEEIGLTQTAVSHQIRLLEHSLGERLFIRRTRQVALTEAGARLAPKITEAMRLMREAVDDMRGLTEATLTIHSTPTFAQKWLSRYIGDFQIRYPQIAVRLEASQVPVDLLKDSADVAIRWGRGHWPGLETIKVMQLDFTPMLSPKLAEASGGIRAPADLLNLQIISAGDELWEKWFRIAGIADPGLERFPRNAFGTQLIDASIAMEGQGVAILNPAHFAEEIAAGKLYQPFDLMLNDGQDYWLAYPDSVRNAPKIKAFREWLIKALPPCGQA